MREARGPRRKGLLAIVAAALLCLPYLTSARPTAGAWRAAPVPPPPGSGDTRLPVKLLREEKAEHVAATERGEAAPAPPPRPSFDSFASASAPEGPPQYELVLARTHENISWVVHVPLFWRITVYNKGLLDLGLEVPGREVTVVKLDNRGRESETYMHHILLRWDTLANYTAFAQATPFVHSPHYLDLLRQPQLLRAVQCMSLVYTAVGHPDNVTPREVVEAHRGLHFNDRGINYIQGQYLQLHNLPKGTNIIEHFFVSIGLPGWVPHDQEVGSFAYGGIFGVHELMVRRHPRHVYANLRASFLAADLHAWLGEKIYLILFGGPHVTDV